MIANIHKILKEAEAILITAGAGMGVDSGLPDFRGDEGLWKAYPPIAKLGIGFSSMANPVWFDKDPFFAWGFYGHRLNLYRETIPHEGFKLLLELVKSKNNNYFIYTSNVDGQFQKAGFDKDKIIECHGSIHHLQCINNCKNDIWSGDDVSINVDMQYLKADTIPQCIHCKDIARPNILMFNDWDWSSKRADNQEARYNKWIKSTRDQKRVIIELGAGTAIATVRFEGEQLAKRNPNTTLIRINPRDFQIDENIGYSISLGALDGIRAILEN